MDKAEERRLVTLFVPYGIPICNLECSSFSRSQYFREFIQTAICIFVLFGIPPNL